MKNFILYDEFGDIKSTGSCIDSDLSLQVRSGLTLLETTKYISVKDGYVLNNEYIPYSEEQYLSKWVNSPQQVGKWSNTTMSWVDQRSTQQKIDHRWYIVKTQRDRLLQQSDWRVVKASDTGIPLSQEWKNYRQALRDITTQTDPFNIIWPTPPTA